MVRTFSLCLILGLTVCSVAHAETFVIDYENRSAVDPAATFEADCLGTTEAADCSQRAALLASELVELLGTLEGYSDAETEALFKAAATLDDPRLQALAVRYFANRSELPTDLWAQLKVFFFGPDATIGQPSAELLAKSLEEADQELARIYLEGRPSEGYGGSLPSGTGETDPWAEAQARDAELDAVDAFAPEQLFTPATRLLMVDRFISGFSDAQTQVPVTGFVTDESVAKVTAHFKALFGRDPYPSLTSSQAKFAALNMELATLQERLQAGDTSVAERFGQVVMELQTVQAAVTLGGLLGLEALGYGDHVYWVDGSIDDLYTQPLPRAVTLGTDALLGRTVIRYVNGQTGDAPLPGDGDGGVPGGDGDGTGSPGDVDGGVGPGQGGSGGKKHSGGGCSVVHVGASPMPWLMLGSALVFARRKRKSRRA